jgi:hypothetical protein
MRQKGSKEERMTDKPLATSLPKSNPVTVTNKSVAHNVRKGLNVTFVTALTIAILVIFLAPFLFMIFTSLKTQGQISQIGAPIWPAKPPTYEYNGKAVEMFNVPMAKCAGGDPNDTSVKVLAVAKKGGRPVPLSTRTI